MSCHAEIVAPQELVWKSKIFDEHLGSLDPKTLKLGFQNYSIEYEGLEVVLLGIKPSFIFESKSSIDFFQQFIPSLTSDNYFITSNNWIVDKEAMLSVILRYQERFPDFVDSCRSEQGYLKEYIEKRSTNVVESSPNEIIKTGLLLGYPLNSVLDFSSCNYRQMASLNMFGYNFAITSQDRITFKDQLKSRYIQSGMESVKLKHLQRVKNDFFDRLHTFSDVINTPFINGSTFLEVKTRSIEDGKLISQLLFVPYAKLTKQEAEKLVSVFGDRYHVPSLSITKHNDDSIELVGVDFESTVTTLVEASNETVIPYMQYDELADTFELTYCVIERSVLNDWLPEDIRNQLV